MLHLHIAGQGIACGKEHEPAGMVKTFAAEPRENRCIKCNEIFTELKKEDFTAPKFPGEKPVLH